MKRKKEISPPVLNFPLNFSRLNVVEFEKEFVYVFENGGYTFLVGESPDSVMTEFNHKGKKFSQEWETGIIHQVETKNASKISLSLSNEV